MNAVNDNTGTPIAKSLNILILVGMVFVALAVLLVGPRWDHLGN